MGSIIFGLSSWQWPFGQPKQTGLIGVIHETEIRIAPELEARLRSVPVSAGQQVRAGQVIAVLSSPETSAAVLQARASAAKARADRQNTYAGLRQEEVNISEQNVRIAQANVALAEQEFERVQNLAKHDASTRQQLDEDAATLSKAKANLASLQATLLMNRNGPTLQERAIADAGVGLADAVTRDNEATLAKISLLAPVDGRIATIVANPGEILSPGQSTMTLYADKGRFATFVVREDNLRGLSVGSEVNLLTSADRTITGKVTELIALGEFATWKAARAVGDHDLNSFLVRVDPVGDSDAMQPGMTVWIKR
jgi:HlyD family secretion protein